MNTFQEFIPGTGLVSSQQATGKPNIQGVDKSNHSDNISPQISKVSKEPTPYWSSANQDDAGTAGSSSQLAISAKEFVPSRPTKDEPHRVGGLSSAASVWVPPQQAASEFAEPEGSGELTEELVEVLWNGNSVFVPESMALEIQGLPQAMEPFGMDWTANLTSLPTPPKRSLQTIGIPEPIRQHFQSLDLTCLRQMDPGDERYKEIPVRFHSAFPLDDPAAQRRAGGSFGYPSCLYKVTDRADSHIYALRRFDNVRLVSASVMKSAQSKWTAVRHPSIVTLYSIAVEKGAVFFAHAYHPSAQTLKQRFLETRSHPSGGSPAVSESLLWRLLAQVSAGVRLVHSRGMAVRSLSPSHILLTSGARFRIANVGVADVLEFESRKTLQDLQVEDLVKLGCLVMSLAARRTVGPKSVEAGMNHLGQNFSTELCRAVAALLTGSRSIDQIISQMMPDKICDELDFAMAASDALHLHLRGEYENGRILRLLLKLGIVNERPEFALSPAWSETGDRYVLQLFRDYLFHQTDGDGIPQLDMGHVISSLNKLDIGDPEQILLSSRNGKDMLVVSFSDVRKCLEMSVADLVHQSQRSGVTTHQSAVPHSGVMSTTAGRGDSIGSKSTSVTRSVPSYALRSPQSQRSPPAHHAHYLSGNPSFPPMQPSVDFHSQQQQQQQYGSRMAQQTMRDPRDGPSARGYSAADIYGNMRG